MKEVQARRRARNAAVALLVANLEAGEGDLWLDAEDMNEVERSFFVDQLRRDITHLSERKL